MNKSSKIVIGTSDGVYCPPCGRCRQLIAEFSHAKTEVVLIHEDQVDVILADKLLPSKFACVQGAHGKNTRSLSLFCGVLTKLMMLDVPCIPILILCRLIAQNNHQVLMRFLSMYSASKDTYQTYRRELERWVQWCWLVRQGRHASGIER